MTVTAIEKTVRRVFDEMWNQQNAALADELFSAKTVIHFSYEQAANLQNFKEALPQWYRAFPDLLHFIDDLIVSGDKVVTRWHGLGTHQHEFLGIPATDMPVFYSGITIFRLDGNHQIAEAWVYSDLDDMIIKMQQSQKQ
ncbi:ester cyclase [Fluoribacter gormanii]|uniref:Predicted ester cyclase n=1 Tax=Fluoribacter gormanii TaxID=464 RepID=A0A377GMU6_9GAMM|nr:ester cyclase [Fluoribacter gormanii]KTD04116.1 SnoaL-like polyketide cyclase [Fluoribacter gormanii]MCW8445509.1 ester cyclase [Fluoribacter gormanii]MCW8470759.1 ester cyclase [Fluoribacter gormanii]SIR88329.1 SnoaL-like polyketide cyclase [Fluoribacter gormanii]STO26121.1 Predicted ester cyclase [Fluoribacter gormanii]